MRFLVTVLAFTLSASVAIADSFTLDLGGSFVDIECDRETGTCETVSADEASFNVDEHERDFDTWKANLGIEGALLELQRGGKAGFTDGVLEAMDLSPAERAAMKRDLQRANDRMK